MELVGAWRPPRTPRLRETESQRPAIKEAPRPPRSRGEPAPAHTVGTCLKRQEARCVGAMRAGVRLWTTARAKSNDGPQVHASVSGSESSRVPVGPHNATDRLSMFCLVTFRQTSQFDPSNNCKDRDFQIFSNYLFSVSQDTELYG